MRERLERLIERVAALSWGPGAVIGFVAAVVVTRNVLEIAVARNPAYNPLAALVHYPLAYFGPFLALTLVLAAGAGWMPGRVARLMAWAWLLTLLPPIADLLLHPGEETPAIAYLDADPVDLPWIWLNFFDPFVGLRGTTPGIRLEAFAAVVLAAIFVYTLTRKLWRALLTAVGVYVVSLFFFSLPVLVRAGLTLLFPRLTKRTLLNAEGWLPRPHPELAPDATAVLWLVPVCAFVGALWWWLERRRGEPGWLHGRLALPGGPSLAGPLQAWLLCGVLCGSLLWLPWERRPGLAPFDLLAVLGGMITLTMLAAGFRRLVHQQTRDAGLLMVLLGVGGASGLGSATAYALLVVAGSMLVMELEMPARWWARAARLVAIPVASCGGLVAGFSLALGPDAFARFPAGLLAIPALSAALTAAATELLAERWRLWVPVGAGGGILLAAVATAEISVALPGVLLAAGGGLVAFFLALGDDRGARHAHWISAPLAAVLLAMLPMQEGARDPLVERVRCVPRLEFLRGQRLEKEGRWESARSAYRRALECDRDYTPALRELGLGALQYDGKPAVAAKRLRRALETNPGSAQELNNLAAAHVEQQRWGEALELLDRALEANPRHLDARFNRAHVLQQLDRAEAAVEAWRSYLRAARGRPELLEDVQYAKRQIRRIKRGASPD